MLNFYIKNQSQIQRATISVSINFLHRNYANYTPCVHILRKENLGHIQIDNKEIPGVKLLCMSRWWNSTINFLFCNQHIPMHGSINQWRNGKIPLQIPRAFVPADFKISSSICLCVLRGNFFKKGITKGVTKVNKILAVFSDSFVNFVFA